MKANGYVMVMLVREREAARRKTDARTEYQRDTDLPLSTRTGIRAWLRRWWGERSPTRPRPELVIEP